MYILIFKGLYLRWSETGFLFSDSPTGCSVYATKEEIPLEYVPYGTDIVLLKVV